MGEELRVLASKTKKYPLQKKKKDVLCTKLKTQSVCWTFLRSAWWFVQTNTTGNVRVNRIIKEQTGIFVLLRRLLHILDRSNAPLFSV